MNSLDSTGITECQSHELQQKTLSSIKESLALLHILADLTGGKTTMGSVLDVRGKNLGVLMNSRKDFHKLKKFKQIKIKTTKSPILPQKGPVF